MTNRALLRILVLVVCCCVTTAHAHTRTPTGTTVILHGHTYPLDSGWRCFRSRSRSRSRSRAVWSKYSFFRKPLVFSKFSSQSPFRIFGIGIGIGIGIGQNLIDPDRYVHGFQLSGTIPEGLLNGDFGKEGDTAVFAGWTFHDGGGAAQLVVGGSMIEYRPHWR